MSPKQTVRSFWKDNRHRRALRGWCPYKGSVINLARWRYLKARQAADLANRRLKLAEANLRATEDEYLYLNNAAVLLITGEVLQRLGHPKKAAAAREQSRKPPRRRR